MGGGGFSFLDSGAHCLLVPSYQHNPASVRVLKNKTLRVTFTLLGNADRLVDYPRKGMQHIANNNRELHRRHE
jgi:hypothetical protein